MRYANRLISWMFLAAVAGCSAKTADEPPAPTGKVYRVDATGSAIRVTVAASEVDGPVDAAPDASGATIYFIASSGADKALFRVPSDGGAVSVVHAGAPFVDPVGLVVSADGSTILVAD